MLLSFPTELLEHIIRLAIPSEYSSATYLERQDTLRAVCLVTRKLRDVAQPVLQEVVRASMEETVKAVEELLQMRVVRGRVRVLALDYFEVAVGAFAAEMVALRDLRLHGLVGDFSWLEHLPALQNLVLSLCRFTSLLLPHLPTVTDLTWVDSAHVTDERPSVLSTASFPALRNLVFWVDLYNGGGGYWPLQLRPEELSHLDTIILSKPLADIDCSKVRPAVLGEVDLDTDAAGELETLLHYGFCHIRLYSGSNPRNLSSDVDAITSILGDPTLSEPLKLFYLPSIFRPSEQHAADLSISLRSLFDLCTSCKIEVDFEDTDESLGGSLISPKFVEYARRMREKEAKKEEERGEKMVW